MNQVQGNDTCSMTHCGWACVVLTCVAHYQLGDTWMYSSWRKPVESGDAQMCYEDCKYCFRTAFCFSMYGLECWAVLNFPFLSIHNDSFCLYYLFVPCKSSIISSSIMYIWAPVIFNPSSLLLAQIVI